MDTGLIISADPFGYSDVTQRIQDRELRELLWSKGPDSFSEMLELISSKINDGEAKKDGEQNESCERKETLKPSGKSKNSRRMYCAICNRKTHSTHRCHCNPRLKVFDPNFVKWNSNLHPDQRAELLAGKYSLRINFPDSPSDSPSFDDPNFLSSRDPYPDLDTPTEEISEDVELPALKSVVASEKRKSRSLKRFLERRRESRTFSGDRCNKRHCNHQLHVFDPISDFLTSDLDPTDEKPAKRLRAASDDRKSVDLPLSPENARSETELNQNVDICRRKKISSRRNDAFDQKMLSRRDESRKSKMHGRNRERTNAHRSQKRKRSPEERDSQSDSRHSRQTSRRNLLPTSTFDGPSPLTITSTQKYLSQTPSTTSALVSKCSPAMTKSNQKHIKARSVTPERSSKEDQETTTCSIALQTSPLPKTSPFSTPSDPRLKKSSRILDPRLKKKNSNLVSKPKRLSRRPKWKLVPITVEC